jgi:fructokinase
MILCCGEALVDMVPEGSDGVVWRGRPGGCPLNTAIGASRLGSRVAFASRLGTDFLGDLLVDSLSAAGVDTAWIARRDEPATLAFVKRSPSGDVRYAFYSNGAADRSLLPTDLPASFGAEARFLMVGSISLVLEPSGSTIEDLVDRMAGSLLVSLDPNLRPSLVTDRAATLRRLEAIASKAAIVKVSDEDLAWLYPGLGEAAGLDRLIGLGPELIVLTRGEAGSLAMTRKARVEARARRVKVADTIGAGDSFHAALLHRLETTGVKDRAALEGLGERDLSGLLDFAGAAAALTCTRVGAEPPTIAELEAFIASTSAP